MEDKQPRTYNVNISARHPAGPTVEFIITGVPWDQITVICNALANAGYQPIHSTGIQVTAEGKPFCPKHNVPMNKRIKQGDVWFSHTVIGPDGQEHYCKGYEGPSSPGYNY